jgi:hypothetical protein
MQADCSTEGARPKPILVARMGRYEIGNPTSPYKVTSGCAPTEPNTRTERVRCNTKFGPTSRSSVARARCSRRGRTEHREEPEPESPGPLAYLWGYRSIA